MEKSDAKLLFSDLLRAKNIDPKTVLVMRHQPNEDLLKKSFHWLAIERPDLYNMYQRLQLPRQEQQLSRAKYLASFIGHTPGKALFIGLYQNVSSKPLTFDQFWKIAENRELQSFGMKGFDGSRQSVLLFDLKLTEYFSDWKGRLTIEWLGGERSWSRWSSAYEFSVDAIHEKTAVEPRFPMWNELVLDWNNLSGLWPTWKAELSRMRGIYLIFDKSDNKGYVGSACGAENLLGRWMNYASTGHGGNKLLRGRDHKNFRYSILELVSPALPSDELIRLEQCWKRRLSTISPHGLNDN